MLMLASTVMNGEKSPVTKTSSFLMLPNDLLLNCIARVSRLYYPTLSLVSKRFRSLLVSLELHQTRTLLSCTESCLYVGLDFPSDPYQPRWYTLSRRQNPNPNPRWFTPCLAPYRFLMNRTKKKEKNLLVSIPTRVSPPIVGCWGLTTIGCNIYKIGGFPSWSRVLFMDCRYHTWHKAPSMQMARKFPCVSVFDEKIYVLGGNTDCDSSNWIEFFDPKTQIWKHVPCPVDAPIKMKHVSKSLAIEGNFFLFGDEYCVVYKPKENRWDDVELMEMPLGWLPSCSCVIGNILYSCRWSKKLEWYDFEGRCWRVLKGLKKLPSLPRGYNFVRLTDYGGKIAVLWQKDDVVVCDEKEIWCAEIALKKRNGHEIRGKVEWCDVVLRVPKSCDFLNLCAVTI